MHAAYAGVEAWAKFWWWPSDGVLEVRSGVQRLAGEGVPRHRLV